MLKIEVSLMSAWLSLQKGLEWCARKTKKQQFIIFFSERKKNWVKKSRNKMKISISLVFALQLQAKMTARRLDWMRGSQTSTFVGEPQTSEVSCKKSIFQWYTIRKARGEGRPRGSQVLVKALSELGNLETALKRDHWSADWGQLERVWTWKHVDSGTCARQCLQKLFLDREDDVVEEQWRLSDVWQWTD